MLYMKCHNVLSTGDWRDSVNDDDNGFFFFDPPYRDSFADYGNGLIECLMH